MRTLFFWLVLFAWYGLQAQQVIEISRNADFIEVDHLEYLYIIKGSEIEKFSSDGMFLCRYSNKINGLITAVDVTNPLRIVLFYSESNVLVFLNQQLSLLSDAIEIYPATESEAVNIGASSNGGIWMYSFDTQSLVLYTPQMKKVRESQNISDLIEDQEIKFIREYKQQVFVGLNSKILIFDIFGSYITAKQFDNATHIKAVAEQISYISNQKLYTYNTTTKVVMPVNYAFAEGVKITAVVAYKQRCYIAQSGKVKIVKL